MDGSGGRNQNAAHGSHAEFRFDAEIGGVLFEALDAILPEFGLGRCCWRYRRLPLRVGQTGAPPVIGGVILLPQQPDLARAFGEQIFARVPHGDRESFRAFADQHDMAGVLHHSLGNKRNVLDVADTADRSGAARGSVHAAGIEFDHSFFVGKAAEADAIIIRIVFGAFNYAEGSVQRIASTFQEDERVVQIVDYHCGRKR